MLADVRISTDERGLAAIAEAADAAPLPGDERPLLGARAVRPDVLERRGDGAVVVGFNGVEWSNADARCRHLVAALKSAGAAGAAWKCLRESGDGTSGSLASPAWEAAWDAGRTIDLIPRAEAARMLGWE